jgi:hypothetical protein
MGGYGDMAGYSGIQRNTVGYSAIQWEDAGYSGIQRDTAQRDTAGYY